MADQRALDALRRIEHAFTRVEAAARPAPSAPSEPSPEHERLREAHERLRRRVAGAIGEVDRLIAAGEQG